MNFHIHRCLNSRGFLTKIRSVSTFSRCLRRTVFSFDEAEKDEVYQFLTSYFANIGGKINIADNKLTFTVDKA